jgi:hypothetical protein
MPTMNLHRILRRKATTSSPRRANRLLSFGAGVTMMSVALTGCAGVATGSTAATTGTSVFREATPTTSSTFSPVEASTSTSAKFMSAGADATTTARTITDTAAAAEAFLATLSDEQRDTVLYSYDDEMKTTSGRIFRSLSCNAPG